MGVLGVIPSYRPCILIGMEIGMHLVSDMELEQAIDTLEQAAARLRDDPIVEELERTLTKLYAIRNRALSDEPVFAHV